jgi:hypothetical protein
VKLTTGKIPGIRWAVLLLLAASLPGLVAGRTADGASDKDKKDKSKPAPGQLIDSGSFGVFIKGQRVVTETFKVQQAEGGSIINSQLKETAVSGAADQKSDLQITSNGELIRYEWSQVSGGSLSVFPNNDFLMEKITTSSAGKPAEQAFLMPSTTNILDNNFFIQREVLAWRHLASACKPEAGNLKCQQGPQFFGALVPQDRSSLKVQIEVVGKEKVTIRGVERELLRLNLSGEEFDWALWVDDHDQFKLIRVAIPADSTEVVRD